MKSLDFDAVTVSSLRPGIFPSTRNPDNYGFRVSFQDGVVDREVGRSFWGKVRKDDNGDVMLDAHGQPIIKWDRKHFTPEKMAKLIRDAEEGREETDFSSVIRLVNAEIKETTFTAPDGRVVTTDHKMIVWLYTHESLDRAIRASGNYPPERKEEVEEDLKTVLSIVGEEG